MPGLVTALFEGRRGKDDSPPGAGLGLFLPLLLLALGMAGAACLGLAGLPSAKLAMLPADAARAAVSSALCLALALPVLLSGTSLPWFLPLWAGPVAGVAGLSLLPLPEGPALQAVETALLLLPVMVLCVGPAFRRSPDLYEAALACGASPARANLLTIRRPVLPSVLRGLALVFCLALGTVTPLLAAASGSP